MTDHDPNVVPEHGSTDTFEGDEVRRDRLQTLIDEGREGELDEHDYAFAIQHGLIEG